MNAVAAPAADPLAGIKIIDCDTHWSEPEDLWTSRAPASMRDRLPQVRVHDGKRRWMMNESALSGAGVASVVAKDGSVCEDWTTWQTWGVEDAHPACSQPKARVELMDQMGVWAQVVYPNILGFGGHKAMKIEPELRLAATQIYNDALADMQTESGQRLFGMALLPWWDVKESVAELRRCAAMGLRGININPTPHAHGLPDLADKHWNPLWEECVAHGLPVNFHIGASEESMNWFWNSGWPSLPDMSKISMGGVMLFMDQCVNIANLLVSDLFDRFPTLTCVSVESGIGWLPYLLEQQTYAARRRGKRALTPKEYFRRNMAACFWYESDDVEHVIRRLGEDNIMFETDFPHPGGMYPDAYDYLRNSLAGADPALLKKVTSTNAARIYNIPV
jgi:predicted TIM-barrel fold metal-dependent hydrolase